MEDQTTMKDIINLVAIIVGPIAAVCITLWWQDRKEKRDAKLKLFVTLMAHRKSTPPSPDWVTALNLIDVAFAEHPRVVELWHALYQLFHNQTRTEAQDHKYLELLSEMAVVLGFRRLKQTDIDKFYSPQSHIDQMVAGTKLQAELLRVLEGTSRFLVAPKVDNSETQSDLTKK